MGGDADQDGDDDLEYGRTDAVAFEQAARDDIETRFDREPIDRDFRDAGQANIEEAVRQMPDSGVSLETVDCRSTMCRIDVSAKFPLDLNALIAHLPEVLDWNPSTEVYPSSDGGPVARATVFLVRG